jgi:N-acetylmuramoyl-L-alanine amidase
VVAAGAYRIEARATSLGAEPMVETTAAWLTVASRPIDTRDPGSITVVVDPGHGGRFDGAVAPDGTREADLNLDVGLRLARMLEGAGVRVVLTRDTDREVNTPPVDRTFDGVIDVTDDLAARADIANAARADLFIAIHTNFAGDVAPGGPSTYHSDERTFDPRSARLARTIQERMVAALTEVGPGDWRPHDHGALAYPYYVLRGYDPPRLLRPTRMPGVLSEGLFLSNPRELRLLQQGRVRQAMANAYYEAIAAYLGRRGSQVGYALERAPAVVVAGAPIELASEVRATGTTALRGWRLAVGAKRLASAAVGRPGSGRSLGDRRVPTLARGARRTVRLTVPAPTEPGHWVLLVDALDGTGSRASRSGSPMLEVPITVVSPSAVSPGDSPPPAARRSSRPSDVRRARHRAHPATTGR